MQMRIDIWRIEDFSKNIIYYKTMVENLIALGRFIKLDHKE